MGNVTEVAEGGKPMPGCSFRALYDAVFRRRSGTSPRAASSSAGSTPRSSSSHAGKARAGNSKRLRSGSDQALFFAPGAGPDSPTPPGKSQLSPKRQIPDQQKGVARRPLERPVKAPPQKQQNRPAAQVPSLSGELDSVLYDHQRAQGSSTLVRASSSNVMLFGNLGNLRAGNPAVVPNRNVLDYLPKTSKETEPKGKTSHGSTGGGTNAVMDKGSNTQQPAPAPVTCRALSKRLGPEEFKDMGDSEYRKGQFAEALALYEQAIVMDPKTALYWNNKAAALIGLGRFLEAVAECREAVKLEPSFCKAHHRLATLYLRLGEAEKAMRHYKQAGSEASAKDMSQARSLQTHLTKCNEARMRRDWHNVLKEAQSALSTGADSAPQVFTSQAEALLKLQRHEEADTALIDAPTFDVDASTKFYGAAGSAYVLVVRAQVDMATGRFDDAVSRAQKAAQIDPNNREIAAVARRTRAVSLARSKGNDLFKASKHGEACAAYGEGLDHDPQNSILLCNRAACRSKLGQWEKAIEDCNLALSLRPSYKKARLRRADCYAKLERWEQSVHDYELLIQEMPADEEVLKALAVVQSHLKETDEENNDQNLCANLVIIKTNDQFTHITTSTGTCVVFFCNKSSNTMRMLAFLEQLCKQYPSFNFLKVDEEDNEYLGNCEVSYLPVFRVYKNGSIIEDLDGSDHDLIESSLKSIEQLETGRREVTN